MIEKTMKDALRELVARAVQAQDSMAAGDGVIAQNEDRLSRIVMALREMTDHANASGEPLTHDGVVETLLFGQTLDSLLGPQLDAALDAVARASDRNVTTEQAEELERAPAQKKET